MNRWTKIALVAAAAFSASAVSTPAFADDVDPLGEELENYWAVDRDLPVLQQKIYTRDGRFGLGLYAGLMSSEPFYWYIPVGGRLSYFFSDHAGLEVGGQYMGAPGTSPGPFTQTTEITDFFAQRLEADFDPQLDLEDRMLWRANASLVWNPFYGKWSFLNNKLSHFDLNLVVGAGVVSVERPNFERTEVSTVITPEINLGGGIHFYLSEDWLLRADGRLYVYQGADTPSTRKTDDNGEPEDKANFGKRIQAPSEFLLGVTYLF